MSLLLEFSGVAAYDCERQEKKINCSESPIHMPPRALVLPFNPQWAKNYNETRAGWSILPGPTHFAVV